MQIVAPAGSRACLKAAITAGADAVYLGLPLFGARAKAENFALETLKSDIDYAHLFGTKVFITLNTLIKDGEMSKALDMARVAYESGADAAIVQDIRFIKNIKRELPLFPLHASTQMGIHNREGALAVLDMGIKRAVLSRETLPEDIKKIKDTGIEIEFFVQGALCISFSGNCYFSSLASSYSGNRGKCMQLCRKPYVFHGKRGYFLSAKDICLYDRLQQLSELGVDAIKIEGRMRSEEYVAQAVRVYRSKMPKEEAVNALRSVFNRGNYCSAYLDGDAPFNVIYSRSQANIGNFVGKIDRTEGKRIIVNGHVPHPADGYKIMRDGEEVGGATVRGRDILSDHACKRGDELCRTFDGRLSEELKALKREKPVKVYVNLTAGELPEVKISADGADISVHGDSALQCARSNAVTRDDIMRAFKKTSDYPYSPEISVDICGEPFMPVSALNELRRRAYQKLFDELAGKNAPARQELPPFALEYNKFDGHGIILMVENERQLNDEILAMVDYIALDPRDHAQVTVPDVGKPVLYNAPITMRGGDIYVIERAINQNGISGVISNNYYTLKLTDKPILLGPGHNIIGECELPHITSFEAESAGNGFVYAFGYAPLMTLCHCPHGKCINCSGEDMLTDEQGRRFELVRYKAAHCYWRLLNCVPNVAKDPFGDRFYDCTRLSRSDIAKVLRGEYAGAFTRGNANKGLK